MEENKGELNKFYIFCIERVYRKKVLQKVTPVATVCSLLPFMLPLLFPCLIASLCPRLFQITQICPHPS